MENINNLYKTAGKCGYQQQHKAIIEASMVSTPEGCTDNSTMTPNPYVPTKKHSARKLLRQFTDTLYIRHKTDFRRFSTAKAKRKATKKGNVL